MQRFSLPVALLALAGLVAIPGCNPEPDGSSEVSDPSHSEGTDEGHEHAHSEEGPHHGGLVELGDEEYHAELVHDDEAGTVTVYILDGSAKQAVPIEAENLKINLTLDGQPKSFELTATPDDADPEGESSRFRSNEAALATALDAEGNDARLVVRIAGKSYNGKLAHEHGHDDDHDHDHDHD